MLLSSLVRLSALSLPVLALVACGGASSPRPVIDASLSTPQAETAPAARPQPVPVAVAMPKLAKPAALKGLNAQQIKSVFGTPGFKRRETPAEIWQYRGQSCTLDLFLYDSADGQTVSHYAVRSPGGLGDQACLDALLAESRSNTAS